MSLQQKLKTQPNPVSTLKNSRNSRVLRWILSAEEREFKKLHGVGRRGSLYIATPDEIRVHPQNPRLPVSLGPEQGPHHGWRAINALEIE